MPRQRETQFVKDELIMEASAPARISVLGLVRDLTHETRTFIKQELQLVKTEISENISRLGRDAAILAAGGFLAYAGLIVFLIGLGWLLTYAFEAAGLDPVLASFLGAALIGLVMMITGGAVLLNLVKKLSRDAVVPHRALHTIEELKTGRSPLVMEKATPPAPNPSTPEVQAQVEATEDRLEETLDELGRRLNPKYINARVKRRLREKPYSASLIAVIAGLLGGLFLRRAGRHS